MTRIDLPGGWYLVMDQEPTSPHYREWFLSTPDRGPSPHEEGVWVAKFWDGPESGATDAIAFALSLGVKPDSGPAT